MNLDPENIRVTNESVKKLLGGKKELGISSFSYFPNREILTEAFGVPPNNLVDSELVSDREVGGIFEVLDRWGPLYLARLRVTDPEAEILSIQGLPLDIQRYPIPKGALAPNEQLIYSVSWIKQLSSSIVTAYLHTFDRDGSAWRMRLT